MYVCMYVCVCTCIRICMYIYIYLANPYPKKNRDEGREPAYDLFSAENLTLLSKTWIWSNFPLFAASQAHIQAPRWVCPTMSETQLLQAPRALNEVQPAVQRRSKRRWMETSGDADVADLLALADHAEKVLCLESCHSTRYLSRARRLKKTICKRKRLPCCAGLSVAGIFCWPSLLGRTICCAGSLAR